MNMRIELGVEETKRNLLFPINSTLHFNKWRNF